MENTTRYNVADCTTRFGKRTYIQLLGRDGARYTEAIDDDTRDGSTKDEFMLFCNATGTCVLQAVWNENTNKDAVGRYFMKLVDVDEDEGFIG